MTREARVLALTDTLARGLLCAYPVAFRRRMGPDLRLCLRDAGRAAWRRGGWPHVLLFGVRAAADLVVAGVAERWEQLARRAWRAPGPAALCAALGGVAWLVMVGNTAGYRLPAGSNAILAAVAAACFGLAVFYAVRPGWGRASDGFRAGAWLAVAGAAVPFVIGVARLCGHPLRSADFMEGFFVMLMGWIVLGAQTLRAGRELPRPVGAALIVNGLAGLWVGVGDRHGFISWAMLPALALIGVLWIVIATWLGPLRPRPADRSIIYA